MPIPVMTLAEAAAAAAGIGALLIPTIGATSTAAASGGFRSARRRSRMCPPIEWPTATCGPGVCAAHAAISASRSATTGSKLS